MQFVDPVHGWVLGRGGLWRTRDAGTHWTRVFASTMGAYGLVHTLDDFQFVDANTGWALFDGKLLRTCDGGDTWKQYDQDLGMDFPYVFAFSRDGRYGWVAGGRERTLRADDWIAGRFLTGPDSGEFAAVSYTRDGGATWSRQPIPRSPGAIGEILLLDERHAWGTGQAGFFRLGNGRWRHSDSDQYDAEGKPMCKSLQIEIGLATSCPIACYFLNSRLGWLANSNGSLAVTRDGGKTWHDLIEHDDVWDTQFTGCFVKLYFTNVHTGWALDDIGDLYVTRDAGRTWSLEISGAKLEDVCFLGSSLAWAVNTTDLFRLAL